MASIRTSRSGSTHSHDDMADSGDDAHAEGAASNGVAAGPGTKKGGKSKAVKEADRKVQNRIAQREFRQRKQQYIKELEAKVAFYETGREGQVERLSEAVNQLLEENLKLRGLLASLGGFIGEGVGGVLPKLGMELPEFNELVAKTVLDNAKDVLDLPVFDKPRSSTAPSSSAAAASAPYPSTSAQTLDSAMPLPPPPPPPIARPQTSSAPPRRASQPTPSPQFSLPPAPLPRPQSPLPAFPQFGLPTAFPPPPLGYDPLSAATAALTSGLPPPPSTSTSTDEICDNYVRRICTDDEEQLNRAIDGIQDTFSMVADTPQVEAFKLIAYHMRNKRDNPSYHLPPSLRLTVTQTTVPHHVFFDGIIFASLRDRLILLKDQFRMEDLARDLSSSLVIHDEDVLVAEAWELSEAFLRKWWYVIDSEVLDISNRWRQERGEPALTMRDIVPSAAAEAAATPAGAAGGSMPLGRVRADLGAY